MKHRGELGREHRERERDIAYWGERDRMELGREYGVGFISRTVILVLADSPKSTISIFGYLNWPYPHRDILRQSQIVKSTSGSFLGKVFTSNSFSGATTLTRITLRFSILVLEKTKIFC